MQAAGFWLRLTHHHLPIISSYQLSLSLPNHDVVRLNVGMSDCPTDNIRLVGREEIIQPVTTNQHRKLFTLSTELDFSSFRATHNLSTFSHHGLFFLMP